MISKQAIKKLAKGSGIAISDSAAETIVALLEKKARKIADDAVKRAKARGSGSVTEDDIDACRVKYGD